MNERIKELVGQAKFIAEESINKQIPSNQELNAFAEKFAELIVRECAEVSKNYAGGSMPVSIASAIKQHFGVK